MENEVVVKLRFKQEGTGAKDVQDMARATKELYTEEEKYQQLLRRRIESIKQNQRLQQDVATSGVSPYKPSPGTDAYYQQQLERRAANIQNTMKMNADLQRMGLLPTPAGPKPPVAPPTFQQQVAQRAASIQNSMRMKEELQRMGLIKTPVLQEVKPQLSPEEQYQADLEKRAGSIQRSQRMSADLKKMGIGAKPAPGWFNANALMGGNVMGALSGAAPFAAVAAALMGLQKALEKATEATSIFMNSTLSAGQRQERLLNMIPGGQTVGRFIAEASGSNERMRQNQRFDEVRMPAIGMFGQFEREKEGRISDVWAAQTQATRVGGSQMAAYPRGDRGTYLGSIQYENEMRTYAPRNALILAEARGGAARENLTDAQDDVARLRRRLPGQQREADQALDRMRKLRENPPGAKGIRKGSVLEYALAAAGPLGWAGIAGFGAEQSIKNKPDVDQAAAARQQALNQLLQTQNAIQDAIARKQERSVELAGAERDIRRAAVDLQRAELDNARAKEQRLSQASTTLGMTHKGQRMLGVQAVKFIQQYGMEAATPEIIAAAQSVAGGWMQKQAEKFGLGTAEGRELQRIGAIEPGDLAGQRKTVDKLQAEVAVNLRIDEKLFAQEIAAAMAATLKDWMKVEQESINIKIKEIQAGQGRQQAAQ